MSGQRSSTYDAAQALLDRIGEIAGADVRDTVDAVREGLDQPALIAVAGRVNAGKSTLVNSLVWSSIAPTSAQEATAVLSTYTWGSPARAEIDVSGQRTVAVPLTRNGPDLTGHDTAEIQHLTVYLQSNVLRTFSILDTPGLDSSVTENSVRTEIGLLETSRGLTPDVLLYVIRGALQPADELFLRRFSEAAARQRREVLRVGLISHADVFGAGPWAEVDPIQQAKDEAAAMVQRIDDLDFVVAASGLLAETARTGAVRESDCRVLHRLRPVDVELLQFAAELGPPPEVTGEELGRLTTLVGDYGIRHGRDHARSLSDLLTWLAETSGLAELEEILEKKVAGAVEVRRVQTALSDLLAAARTQAWPSEIRAEIERAMHGPQFHRLKEWSALQALKAADPRSSLVAVLEDLCRGGDGQLDEDYLRLASDYQARVNTASSSAEAQAARVLARSMLLRHEEAS